MLPQASLLQDCELFTGLSPEALERISAIADHASPPAETVLFRMGELADRMFAVVRGRVLLSVPFRIEGAEQDLTVDEKVPGEIVGWSALVPPHRATVAARTVVNSELLVFPRDALIEVLRGEPEVGLQVMSNVAKVLGRRLHQTQALWMRELQRGINSPRL